MIVYLLRLIFKCEYYTSEDTKVIKFDRLWDTMEKKEITQYKLIKVYGISPAQITRLKRNNNVNTYTLNRLCEILDCNIEDIMKYEKE